jgi:pimeloyl-ACP methyl ester carboxylesterase
MRKILIIRGWRSDDKEWQAVKKFLKRENSEVLSPDLPGFDNAPKITRPWTINDYKNWLLRYTKEKEWKKFNVLGHSFGGAIAAKFAADCPEKVENLILCAPAIFGTKSVKSISYYLTAQTLRGFFYFPGLRKHFPAVKTKLSSLGIKRYYFEEGVMRKTLLNLRKENYNMLLGNVRAETLIVWGEKDDSISVKYAEKIKKKIKKTKLVVFPLIKHHPHKEVPEKLAKEIIKFIK